MSEWKWNDISTCSSDAGFCRCSMFSTFAHHAEDSQPNEASLPRRSASHVPAIRSMTNSSQPPRGRGAFNTGRGRGRGAAGPPQRPSSWNGRGGRALPRSIWTPNASLHTVPALYSGPRVSTSARPAKRQRHPMSGPNISDEIDHAQRVIPITHSMPRADFASWINRQRSLAEDMYGVRVTRHIIANKKLHLFWHVPESAECSEPPDQGTLAQQPEPSTSSSSAPPVPYKNRHHFKFSSNATAIELYNGGLAAPLEEPSYIHYDDSVVNTPIKQEESEAHLPFVEAYDDTTTCLASPEATELLSHQPITIYSVGPYRSGILHILPTRPDDTLSSVMIKQETLDEDMLPNYADVTPDPDDQAAALPPLPLNSGTLSSSVDAYDTNVIFPSTSSRPNVTPVSRGNPHTSQVSLQSISPNTPNAQPTRALDKTSVVIKDSRPLGEISLDPSSGLEYPGDSLAPASPSSTSSLVDIALSNYTIMNDHPSSAEPMHITIYDQNILFSNNSHKSRYILKIPYSSSHDILCVSMHGELDSFNRKSLQNSNIFPSPVGPAKIDAACLASWSNKSVVVLGRDSNPDELSIILWDDGPRTCRRVSLPRPSTGKRGISALTALSTSSKFASGGYDHEIRLWSLNNDDFTATSSERLNIKHTSLIQSLLHIGDTSSKLISAGADRNVHLYDLSSERVVNTLKASNSVYHVHETSSSFCTLLEVAHRELQYEVRDHRTTPELPVQRFGYNSEQFAGRFIRGATHDNLFACGDSNGYVRLWDFRKLPKPVNILSCLPGQRIVDVAFVDFEIMICSRDRQLASIDYRNVLDSV